MNRSDLINELRNRTSLTRKDAEKFVETFFGSISDTLAKNERVEIRGFGSFTVKKYKPYVGRNPKTGESVSLEGKYVPHFKPGKELRERVNESISS